MSGFHVLTMDKLEKSFASSAKDKEDSRLKGKSNWVQWEIRVKMSLGMSACKELLKGIPAQKEESRWTWGQVDEQVANFLLQACDFNIAAAFYHLVDDGATPPFTYNVYTALKKAHGTSDAQYTFALGRKFIDNRCDDSTDVNAWINEVRAQYRELSTLKFDLTALCINVILNGLPTRLDAFADSVFATEEAPTIDSICERLLRVDAGQKNRESTEIPSALYARSKGRSKFAQPSGPSKEHPCNFCGSFLHWKNECSDFKASQRPESNLATVFTSISLADRQEIDFINPDSDIGIANAF